MPFIRRFLAREENRLVHITPQLPAVTSTMQATFLTGRPPGGHGIVANMWYDRAYSEHRCWKQSNHLVEGRKLWHRPDRRQCGLASLTSITWENEDLVAVTYSEPAGEVSRRAGKGA